MIDLEFYNAGCGPAWGVGRGVAVGLRRLLRRVLRPMFFHQVEIYRAIQRRIDELEAKAMKLRAGELDQRAQARRLAALEDRLEQLLTQLGGDERGGTGATTLPLETRGAREAPRQAG
jgi:hypothetical protein